MGNNTTRFKHRTVIQQFFNFIKIQRVKKYGVFLGSNTYIMGGHILKDPKMVLSKLAIMLLLTPISKIAILV